MMNTLNRGNDNRDEARLDGSTPSPPVIRYVNLLLYCMFPANKSGTRILRQSEPVPPLSTLFDEDIELPPLDSIINRLKVMVALNPIIYPEPVEGAFQVKIEGVECQFKCRFDDNSDDRCTIEVEKM